MLISLHKQATTTPKVRSAIQASDEPAWVLAERYGTSEQTIWKWRKRDSVHDRSHTPHRLQTTLTPAQETVVVELRKILLLPLDDLLAVVHEFLNPNVSQDEEMMKRFVHELRYSRKITHRNVIRIYDFLNLEGAYAISMEYFPSHTLSGEIPDNQPMDVQNACAPSLLTATARRTVSTPVS